MERPAKPKLPNAIKALRRKVAAYMRTLRPAAAQPSAGEASPKPPTSWAAGRADAHDRPRMLL